MGGEMSGATNVLPGEFLYSKGIDPDLGSEISIGVGGGTIYRPIEAIVGIQSVEKSTATLTGMPIWFITNPKNALLYAYSSDGKVFSYATSAYTETSIGTPTSGAGNGGAYYNNYIYFATPTNISRYGPLSGTPTLVNTVWSGTTLGSQKVLTNTTYPDITVSADGGTNVPNHAMHVHSDNKLYICDYSNGQGLIHFIRTTHTLDYDGQTGNFTVGLTVTGGTSGATGIILADSDAGTTGTLTLTSVVGTFANNEAITDSSTGAAVANGTTLEGAGNNGSTYGALDLPYGFKPVDIESYGTDIAILAFQGTGGYFHQGVSMVFFWDTVSNSFYNEAPIPDTLGTALLNDNGTLYVFASNGANTYCSTYKYLGGQAFQKMDTKRNATATTSPFASAVESINGRITFSTGHEIRAIGYTRPGLLGKAKNNVAVEPNNKFIGGLKFGAVAGSEFAGGLLYGSATGLMQVTANGSTALSSEWRSEPFYVGKPFRVLGVRFPFTGPMEANVTITPSIICDQDQTWSGEASGLPVMNSTNYPTTDDSRGTVADMAPIDAWGFHTFHLKLVFTGTNAGFGINMPIEIEIEIFDD